MFTKRGPVSSGWSYLPRVCDALFRPYEDLLWASDPLRDDEGSHGKVVDVVGEPSSANLTYDS